MSIYPSPDKLDKTESKYALVILAAKRARQIKDGARRLTGSTSPNPLTVALEEIAEGAIIARVVEDPAAAAQRAALRPSAPTLEDIIGAGPVLSIESDNDSPASQLAALRSAEPMGDDDELLEDDGDDVLTPVDKFVEDAPGLMSEMDEDDDLIPSSEDEDE
jgi:DNA-directed RNA polymerase subunit omega